MAIRRQKTAVAAETPPRAIAASAARVSVKDAGWDHYRFTDEGWQVEGWRHYDINEQLHNSCEYVGSACSLVRLYVAEVDDNGRIQGEVTDDQQIASLVDTLFGGPASKAEILRNLGISLTVAGECYLIGIAGSGRVEDRWMVAAPSEVRTLGRTFSVDIGGGRRISLNPGKDIIIRVWTPHPRKADLADSPVRACLPLLYEMEQLRGFLNSQLNSRIANASILPVPSTLSVLRGDSQAASTDDVYTQLYEVITSNLAGKATAAQVAPILWPMPLEELQAMAGIEPIRFESPLSEQAIRLREEARMKLAIGLNVPVDIQLGGDSRSNHWSVWFSSEEFVLKTIAPLFNRIVEAITLAYLVPALKALGKDPDRFAFAYDTAPLANSANKLADTLNLYERGLVSGAEVRKQGGYTEAAAPAREEEEKRFVKEVILRDPTLFATPAVREAVGVEIDSALPELATPPPPPPAPGRAITAPEPGQKPARPAITDNAVDSALNASARPAASPTYAAANSAVIRALELAGKRLLTPAVRGQFANVPATKLHTKLRLNSRADKDFDTLLAGAWDYLPDVFEPIGVDPQAMRPVLDSYVRTLLRRSIEHVPSLLAAALDQAGV